MRRPRDGSRAALGLHLGAETLVFPFASCRALRERIQLAGEEPASHAWWWCGRRIRAQHVLRRIEVGAVAGEEQDGGARVLMAARGRAGRLDAAVKQDGAGDADG